MLQIGAHIAQEDPLAEAHARQADLVQLFLGDPQSWKAPVVGDDVVALAASDLPLYVHAPYLVNVATGNNRVRIPSRKILAAHADAAAALGARALIVHGGHVGKGEDVATGIDNWRKTFARWEPPLPVLIENTAGGEGAMARRLEVVDRLWDAVGGFANVGFCLDTCHAHAGGEELPGLVERVVAITGRIDLVHANDSRDAFGSGADRHANLGQGKADAEGLLAAVAAAGAPVVVETPGGADGQGADIAWLRERLLS